MSVQKDVAKLRIALRLMCLFRPQRRAALSLPAAFWVFPASSVGKSMTRLWESLGVRLFHRSTRSVTLTAEGEMFVERARRILAEFDAAQAGLSEASEVRIGCCMSGFR
jgi:hypothetical protein